MSGRDLYQNAYDEATETKLEIFENYLKEWLPTFIYGSRTQTINIVDFFAGCGFDVEGNPGSPVRILRIIKEYKEHIIRINSQIRVLLNEKNSAKYKELKKITEDEIHSIGLSKRNLKVTCTDVDFEILFDVVKPYLSFGNNFLFFDQNGIKYFTKEILLFLDEAPKTDFMVFVSSSFVNRFDFPDHIPGFTIDKKNEDYFHIHQNLIEYYKKWIPPGSNLKLYPFSLKKENSGNIYGLIFGSKNLLGVEKFLKVAWNKNRINGCANYDIDRDLSKGQRCLFGDNKLTKLELFENDLRGFILSSEMRTNQEVLDFTFNAGHIPTHAKEVLIKMRNEKLIEHFSYPKIGYNQIYNDKDIVIFRVKNG